MLQHLKKCGNNDNLESNDKERNDNKGHFNDLYQHIILNNAKTDFSR